MTIRFSAEPGRRERHLQRKYQYSDVFPADRREVTQEQVDEARREDEQEEHRFRDAFHQLLTELGELQGQVDTERVLELKERLERLYEQCAGLGGERRTEKEGLRKLNEVIVATLRRAAESDPVAAEELDRESAAWRAHVQLLEFKLVADVLSSDSPLEGDELVPALLSADRESVRMVMSLFDPEQQDRIREQARELVETLGPQAPGQRSVREALSAMQVPLQ